MGLETTHVKQTRNTTLQLVLQLVVTDDERAKAYFPIIFTSEGHETKCKHKIIIS
jgi:hypothetical protein